MHIVPAEARVTHTGIGEPSIAQRETLITHDIGLEAVSHWRLPGTSTRGIGDRRDEEPDLDQERDDVDHVPVGDVECREPDPDARGGEQRRGPDHGKQQCGRGRGEAVDAHDHEQQHRADQEVRNPREDRSDRNGQPREVDLETMFALATTLCG